MIGADKDTTIIDGRGRGGDVVYIDADNVVFKGFTVRRSGRWPWGYMAIFALMCEGVLIQDNIITDNQVGFT